MVRHYALKPKASIRPYLLKRSLRELFGLLFTWICIQTHNLYTNPRGQKSKELSKRAFQQVRTYGSLGFKGIVSDHRSTALAVTYIGYGFKNPTNLGLFSLKLRLQVKFSIDVFCVDIEYSLVKVFNTAIHAHCCFQDP